MTTPVHEPAEGTTSTHQGRRALVAGSVGNFIEWYEFGVYGYFATIIAANFFTPDGGGDAEALVKTYASFALAFFFRPVGAVFFGRVGDRIGRRPTLILVVLLMTAATTLIGLCCRRTPRWARRRRGFSRCCGRSRACPREGSSAAPSRS